MEAHEYANLFPMAADEELRDMAEDIKQRGLVCPIITLDDKVLDGRNRLRACELAGVTPRFQKYTGSDPLADVVSWNLKRRHLSTSQKAALAVSIKPMFEEQAKERQRAAGGDHKALMANLPQAVDGKGTARDQAAAAVGVSGRIVQDAEHVNKHAPEVFEEVKAGKLTVNAAKEELRRREEKLKPVMTKQEAASMRPRVGMKYAKVAIGNLQQIQDNDEERAEAFATVKGWINEHEA
jgi:ParB-like chromosome segregation protein Spo0J